MLKLLNYLIKPKQDFESKENIHQAYGQHASSEIEGEYMKSNIMNISNKMCHKVSATNAQKVSGRGDENTWRLEKILFRKDQDFTLTLKKIKIC